MDPQRTYLTYECLDTTSLRRIYENSDDLQLPFLQGRAQRAPIYQERSRSQQGVNTRPVKILRKGRNNDTTPYNQARLRSLAIFGPSEPSNLMTTSSISESLFNATVSRQVLLVNLYSHVRQSLAASFSFNAGEPTFVVGSNEPFLE
ncbi:hypothetical protein PM082_021393 [Marasmius tenuissimus]|nr:hypothetical protein PM082_021393 [Marasmius tenuissimus]